MNELSDQWQTPQWLYDELNEEFHFDIDLCATKENSKCDRHCADYLKNTYQYVKDPFLSPGDIEFSSRSTLNEGEYKKDDVVCFMNPPYSNPKPFIEKAWEDSKHCTIVCLLPNTIKTCKYMDILDINEGMSTYRTWKEGIEIRDSPRRVKFTNPYKKASSPSFGCMLIIMNRRKI